MSAYEGFAGVYDIFMEEVDYPAWVAHLHAVWDKFGLHPKTIADLGCGTGNVLLPLAQAGYQVMGVDISEDMLAEANRKIMEEGLHVPLFCQDMTELELPNMADCIISLCDSLNYLTEDGELSDAFCRVKRHLNSDGLFLFDMNTEYKFQEVLGEKTYAATTEEAAYFWENRYDEEDKINEYYVTFFLKQTEKDLYERTEEYHYERAYSIVEIENCLSENGLELLAVYDGYSFLGAQEESQRYFFVARHKEDFNA